MFKRIKARRVLDSNLRRHNEGYATVKWIVVLFGSRESCNLFNGGETEAYLRWEYKWPR